MLSLEEYIAKRKKEDKLDEFDYEQRLENIKTCVEYVLEYYTRYLGLTEGENRSAIQENKLNNYKEKIKVYSPDVQKKLIEFYDNYHTCVEIRLNNFIKSNAMFLIYNTENEFRNLSYECYDFLSRKLPYLKKEGEFIFVLLKDTFRIKSEENSDFTFLKKDIKESVVQWMEKIYYKYDINIYNFAYEYILKFEEGTTRIREKDDINYSIDPFVYYDYKQSQNLFNLDNVYPKIAHKPFIKGKRKELELIMMYVWTNGMLRDKRYWKEYLDKVLPYVK